jgi:bifunctional ADP-heptose synthase (sugar kinase/adenylyltransferase)
MGLPWEHKQQNDTTQQQPNASASLEERVLALEQQVQRLDSQLTIVVRNLENKLGDDLNNDGTIPV